MFDIDLIICCTFSYPDCLKFNAACSALVRKYPALQDRVVFRDNSSAAKYVSVFVIIWLIRQIYMTQSS